MIAKIFSLFLTRCKTRHPSRPDIGSLIRHQKVLSLMARETIEIQLTPKERTLLMRYGYSFEGIEQALKACESSREITMIPMDRFELEHLIGDVCRSINHMKSGRTQDQLLDLCDRLEAAERHGEGMLDTL